MFNGDHFETEGNSESNNNEKRCFGFFGRFVTRGLILRPRNTYIYVFQTLFGFCSFYVTSWLFWKLGVNSLHSTLNIL